VVGWALGRVLAEGVVLACAGAPVEMAAPQVQQAASNPSDRNSGVVRAELRSVIAGTSQA
jgi:hypothetical protein